MDESDKEILFKAVLSDPASDTPRLALAEWLDRYGDPARAEFIRVQCGLAKCGPPHKRPAHADVPTPVKPLGDRHYAIHGFPGDEYRIGDRVDILVHRDLKAPRVVHGFRVYKIVPFTEPSMRGESTVYCRLDDESGPWKGTELLGRSDELMTPGNISAWSGQKAEAKRPVDRYGIRRIAVFGTPPSTDLEWTWSCGFVSAIRCSWAMWLRYADEIFWSPRKALDDLPSELWIDIQCEEAFTDKPEGEYLENPDYDPEDEDSEEKEWIEPCWEDFYKAELREIKAAIVGDTELVNNL